MANISKRSPKAPFDCAICSKPARIERAGPGCLECLVYQQCHYFPRSEGDEDADVVFIGDHPDKPAETKFERRGEKPTDHFAFGGDGGKVVRSAVVTIKSDLAFHSVKTRYTYAVKCAVDNATKELVQACAPNLAADLATVINTRRARGKTNPLVLVAHGVPVLHSLGVKVKNEDDAKGKVFDHFIGDTPVKIVFTRSLKAIAAAPGTYESTLVNLRHAFEIAAKTDVAPLTREGMAAGHIYPKTTKEALDLIQYIRDFTAGSIPADQWKISFDTETDTLYPTKGVTLTCVSISWASGKSCAIPLWHSEVLKNPDYDIQVVWEALKELLVFKPCVLHNARYDIKVMWKLGADLPNVVWDTMLAEHVLREDAKGFYGLKSLTAEFFPELAGYQSHIEEFIEESDNEEIKEAVKGKGVKPAVKMLAVVEEALVLLNTTTKFREKTLQEKLAAWEASSDDHSDKIKAAKVLLAAKQAGEFKAKKEKKKIEQGGYENIPLPDLLFYAAVDADATRRLWLNQVKRMHAEDAEIEDRRGRVNRLQSMSGKSAMQSIKRSTTEHPRNVIVLERSVPRMRALADIEYHGIRVDKEYLTFAQAEIETAVGEAQRRLNEMAGEEFKPKSPQQLQRFICDTGIGYIHPEPAVAEQLALANPDIVKFDGKRLMYRVPREYFDEDAEGAPDSPFRFTEKGAVQTDSPLFKRLVASYKDPFADLNLAFRKAHTIKTSFLKNIATLLEFYGDGTIHAGYNQPGAATGRLSSSSGVRKVGFNNQNIPGGSVGKVYCKKLFIPDSDEYWFVNADGKGAEVSILTAYAPDPALIASLHEGRDTHSFFSSKILNPDSVAEGLTGEKRRVALANAAIDDDHGWTYEDFVAGKDGLLPDASYNKRLKDLRDRIKKVVFGTLFGAGYKKIAELAGVSRKFAKAVIELFFKMFPSIDAAIKHARWHLGSMGNNETFHGRMRRFMVANAPSGMKARAERQGFNFLVQGTNSDVVLDVLVEVYHALRHYYGQGARLLLTVHDSIGFQFPKKYIHELGDFMKKYGTDHVKERCPWLPVPFRWDIEVGPSYGSLTKYKKFMEQLAAQQELLAPPQASLFEGYTDDEQMNDMRAALSESSHGGGKGTKVVKESAPA